MSEYNTVTLSQDDFVPLGKRYGDSDAIYRPSVSYWSNVWRRLRHDKVAIVSTAVILVVVLLAVFAPVFSPYGYETTDTAAKNLGPSAEHLFGTDSVGRDLWTRVWMGARVSLLIGLIGAIVPQIIGVILGGISGYFGGWVDNLIMRVIDVGYCIPQLIYVTFIMIYLDSGPVSIILAISITGWMGSARTVRARIMQYKSRDFVLAARTMGAKPGHLIFKSILPNVMGQQVVLLTSGIPTAIFTEAYLSFIGLGVKSPMTSLGQLSQLGSISYRLYPYQLFIPSVIIGITILAFYLLGNCMRDALDPHMVD